MIVYYYNIEALWLRMPQCPVTVRDFIIEMLNKWSKMRLLFFGVVTSLSIRLIKVTDYPWVIYCMCLNFYAISLFEFTF